MGQPTALISPHLSQDVKFLEKPNFKRARSELAAHGGREHGKQEGTRGRWEGVLRISRISSCSKPLSTTSHPQILQGTVQAGSHPALV